MKEEEKQNLENAADEEEGDECIKVDVDRVEPFDELLRTVRTLVAHEVVHQIPQNGRNAKSRDEGDKRPLKNSRSVVHK